MKAPDFWSHGKANPIAGILSPLGALYGIGTRLRRVFKSSWKSPLPVICVGNLIAGGAGKTPVTIDLVQRLSARGVKPHVLTRGYGGQETGPLLVSSDLYDARLVGDEPLMISEYAPTWVARDRMAASRAAMVERAGCIVMDDGFQDPSVEKDISLIVVDGGYGFGNGYQIPAGPLRESVAQGIARADAVILIGEDTTGVEDQVRGHCPVIRAAIKPGPEAETLRDRRMLAFAGIGRPEKFFDTLREIGCEVVSARAFADHHNYSRAELVALKEEAERVDAGLVTTAKDWVRIPPEMRDGIDVLTINLIWGDEDEINALLEPIVSDAS